jgi:hypothetical protein
MHSTLPTASWSSQRSYSMRACSSACETQPRSDGEPTAATVKNGTRGLRTNHKRDTDSTGLWHTMAGGLPCRCQTAAMRGRRAKATVFSPWSFSPSPPSRRVVCSPQRGVACATDHERHASVSSCPSLTADLLAWQQGEQAARKPPQTTRGLTGQLPRTASRSPRFAESSSILFISFMTCILLLTGAIFARCRVCVALLASVQG